jgi:hypothetical protein
MNPTTSDFQHNGAHPLLWVAGAVSVGIGVASWAYKRRRRSAVVVGRMLRPKP